ncbi:MAG: hypothetical protein ABR564_03200 [Candidatus Dormibacteria bacterium]
MSRPSARWRPIFVVANVLVLLGLIGVALWISLRPASPDKPGATPNPLGAGAPRVTRNPVFSVAPTFPASIPLTPTQALLTGHVLDAGTRAPLAGAQVDIDQAGGKLTLHTDATGRFATAVETARPFGFTVDAAKHGGGVGFGKLCPGDRKDFQVPLPPAGGPPSAPVALQGSAC